MSLERKIVDWDGKSSDEIASIYASYSQHAGFATDIVRLVKGSLSQKGATWLLKAWLEAGNVLEKKHIKDIYGSLSLLEHWESRLHVLQCIPFMPIENRDKRKVESFLRNTLEDSNKFVRAWSYNGFYELARQHAEYVNEVKAFFEMAMRDEAASVKARVRNIMKKGF